MFRTRTSCIACAMLMASAFSNGSLAGGFDRFDQGIELLFDPSKVAFEGTFTSWLPNRKFNTVNGSPETVRVDRNAFWPSLNVKFVPLTDVSCLGSYRQPFGAQT